MSVRTQTLNINQQFVELFKENYSLIARDSPEYVNKLRQKGIEKFQKLGIPDKKKEEYKYTALDKLFSLDLKKSFTKKEIKVDINDLFHCDVPDIDTQTLMVTNGFYHDGQKALNKVDNGIIYGSLSAATREYPELVEKHYGRYADMERDGLVGLNTAFAQDGFFMYIPENTVAGQPLQIVHLLFENEDSLVQYRNLIIAEENAQAKILVCDHTLSPFHFLSNTVTEIYAGANSNLEYDRIQNEHLHSNLVTNLFIHQEKGSNLTTNTISLHGGMIRNNIYVKLDGEFCENHTLGLQLVDREQHVDSFVFMDHAKPNCFSNQLFKGIYDDQGTGAFTGRILVRQDAQKTNAYQSNNNILLSKEADVNSKPQLEIYADDVKCSHGATVGQLDPDAIFYLRSRGISEGESMLLMMYAFAHEIIDKISIDPLRERITELVDKRLRGELSRCNNCAMKCGEISNLDS